MDAKRSTRYACLAALAAFGPSVHAASPYCLAGEPCFPSEEVFSQLADSLTGRLIKSEPYGAPCYNATYDAERCLALANTVRTFDFREAEAAAVMYVNHELTEDGEGCPVPMAPEDGSPPPPVEGECVLGNMASYVVNATSADDVQAAVRFASEHNLRLRIKNSGHCYTGRSTGEGAFTIWTRHLNDAELISDFVPEGGDGAGVEVVAAGPGVNVGELVQWGADNARVAVAGYTPSVGAMGGYLLGGGMGPLAPLYGMAVDNVQQFEVVTADGEKKIANEYVNSDLFWALRGGGGAFAAVTQVWVKVYPALDALNTVTGPVICEDKASYDNMIDVLMELQVPLRDQGHTGIWQVTGASRSLLIIDIFFMEKGDEIVDANSTFAELEPLTTLPGCTASLKAQQFTGEQSYSDAYHAAIWATAGLGSNPGRNLIDASRVVSYDMVRDEAKRAEIKELITSIDPAVPFIWQNNCGGAITDVATDTTPVHPAWRDAMSWVVIPVSGPWSGLTAEQFEKTKEADEILQSVFGSASYYNEQSAGLIDNWQDSWWGSNYDRLLSIKKDVDPTGVFSCEQCVGSELGI